MKVEIFIASVALKVATLAGREIIQYHDFVTFAKKIIDKMTTDEAGAAGD
jgi:CRISPR/Cas system CSM-associated protein Csm2 small subunit